MSQATAPSRKEAIIELADDDTAEPEDEMIVGIRFHVPDVDGEEDNEEEMTPAEQLIAQIKESGDLETSGTAIAGFEDVGITVPRGRYDLEFFDKHFKMHGKTYDYKVLYSNVSSVYVLPKQDNYTVAFAISLEHPLRQGATMYPHIIMQLPREAVVEVNVNLPDAERERRFDDKLDKQESGDLVDVLPKVRRLGERGRCRRLECWSVCPAACPCRVKRADHSRLTDRRVALLLPTRPAFI